MLIASLLFLGVGRMYEIVNDVLKDPLTYGALIGVAIMSLLSEKRKNVPLNRSLLLTMFYLACTFVALLIGHAIY